MKKQHDDPVQAWTRQDWILAILILSALIVASMLVIVPAFAANQEAPECYITGKVYGAEALAEVDARLEVPSHCPISWSRFERRLVITSAHWRVEMELPRAGGWMDFRYTWGRPEAYFGAQPVVITATPAQLVGAR